MLSAITVVSQQRPARTLHATHQGSLLIGEAVTGSPTCPVLLTHVKRMGNG